MEEQLPSKLQRVLHVLSLIQSGARLNAVNIAAEVGVSRRTIFRDVNLLRDSGIPIFFDDAWDSYRIDPAFRLPRLGQFTEDEIGLLVLAAQTSQLHDSPDLSKLLRRALFRFINSLPIETKNAGSTVVDYSACVSTIARPIDANVVSVCIQGIQRQLQLRLQIDGKEENDEVQLAPWHLLRRSDDWSILGRTMPDGKNCKVNLQRIKAAIVTNVSFERPLNVKLRHLVSFNFPDY